MGWTGDDQGGRSSETSPALTQVAIVTPRTDREEGGGSEVRRSAFVETPEFDSSSLSLSLSSQRERGGGGSEEV